MRLYSLTGATAVTDEKFGRFEADADDGRFDFPEELANQLHRFHVGGRPMWETSTERESRLAAEAMEHRRDPATLLAVVERLTQSAQVTAPATA